MPPSDTASERPTTTSRLPADGAARASSTSTASAPPAPSEWMTCATVSGAGRPPSSVPIDDLAIELFESGDPRAHRVLLLGLRPPRRTESGCQFRVSDALAPR